MCWGLSGLGRRWPYISFRCLRLTKTGTIPPLFTGHFDNLSDYQTIYCSVQRTLLSLHLSMTKIGNIHTEIHIKHTFAFFYFWFWLSFVGRDNSVGMATCYGLDGPGIESRWGAIFSVPVQTGPGAHTVSYTLGTGSLPGVRRPGRGVDHPQHLAPGLKKECIYNSTPRLGLAVLGWTLLHSVTRLLQAVTKNEISTISVAFKTVHDVRI